MNNFADPRGDTFEQAVWPRQESFKELEPVHKEVPEGIYAIDGSRERTRGKYGLSVVLKLITKDGNQFRTWAPKRLVEELEEGSVWFILNEGVEVLETTGNEYFKFKLA